MSDVTRYEVDGLDWAVVWAADGGYVLHADHLAAMERVRAETLREAKRAVINNDGWLDAMKAIDKAIDRLIDTTTTGATDA